MSQAAFVQLQFSPQCSIRVVNSQDYRKSFRRLCSNHIHHHQSRTLKPSSSTEDSLPCKANAHSTRAHRIRAHGTRAHHTRPTTPGLPHQCPTPGPTTPVRWGSYEGQGGLRAGGLWSCSFVFLTCCRCCPCLPPLR